MQERQIWKRNTATASTHYAVCCVVVRLPPSEWFAPHVGGRRFLMDMNPVRQLPTSLPPPPAQAAALSLPSTTPPPPGGFVDTGESSSTGWRVNSATTPPVVSKTIQTDDYSTPQSTYMDKKDVEQVVVGMPDHPSHWRLRRLSPDTCTTHLLSKRQWWVVKSRAATRARGFVPECRPRRSQTENAR